MATIYYYPLFTIYHPLSSFDALFDLDYYLNCFYSNRVRSEQ